MLMPAGSGDLYEKRKGVYPKAVDGFYRRFKWAVMAVMAPGLLLLTLQFIRRAWNGLPENK